MIDHNSKNAQPPRPFQPRYERKAITDAEILKIKGEAVADEDVYLVRVCERAIAGDVSAVNACKALIHGLLD